jgi:hypothetical protein
MVGFLIYFLTALRVWAGAVPFYLILDPYFYRSPVTVPVEGSKETVLAFYRVTEEGTLAPAKPGELSEQDQTIAMRQTKNHVQKLLETIRPEIIRDSHGVITALRLQSTDPVLSGIFLLPDIDNRFENLLGPNCLFAVPNRQTILCFPRLASDVQSFSSLVLTLYHNDPWPVSTEIFEIAGGKLRANGRFNEDF